MCCLPDSLSSRAHVMFPHFASSATSVPDNHLHSTNRTLVWPCCRRVSAHIRSSFAISSNVSHPALSAPPTFSEQAFHLTLCRPFHSTTAGALSHSHHRIMVGDNATSFELPLRRTSSRNYHSCFSSSRQRVNNRGPHAKTENGTPPPCETMCV